MNGKLLWLKFNAIYGSEKPRRCSAVKNQGGNRRGAQDHTLPGGHLSIWLDAPTPPCALSPPGGEGRGHDAGGSTNYHDVPLPARATTKQRRRGRRTRGPSRAALVDDLFFGTTRTAPRGTRTINNSSVWARVVPLTPGGAIGEAPRATLSRGGHILIWLHAPTPPCALSPPGGEGRGHDAGGSISYHDVPLPARAPAPANDGEATTT